MVTTRRQEQLLHTPPGAGAAGDERQQQHAASPATPADADGAGGGGGPPTTARGRRGLKSALKPSRLAAMADEDEGTPAGAGIKKRVRIHSSNNVVHEFQTSHSGGDPSVHQRLAGACGWEEEDEEEGEEGEERTPDSGGPRRRRPAARGGAASSSARSRGLLFRYSLYFSGGGRSRSGARRRGGGGGRAASGGEESALMGLLFTLSWMVASSALIFANKRLMVDLGFRYPFALTSMGQASSTLLAYLVAVLGLAPLRPAPSARGALTRLLPVSMSFAATLFLGNVAYLGLSVAFINIMKAATPMVTLTLGLALGLERLSKLTLAATALIALGTYTATASEASSGHFDWLSFLAFAASVVFEGIRVVMTEKLLGQARYNVMEALVYLGPFTCAALALGALLFEWDQGLSTTGWAVLSAHPREFAFAFATSFLVNLFCYLAIKHVSATSFKVAGCLKNVLVVWGGILQGDVVTPRELQGYAISLAGFVLFSASRWRAAAKAAGYSADSPSPHKARQGR